MVCCLLVGIPGGELSTEGAVDEAVQSTIQGKNVFHHFLSFGHVYGQHLDKTLQDKGCDYIPSKGLPRHSVL